MRIVSVAHNNHCTQIQSQFLLCHRIGCEVAINRSAVSSKFLTLHALSSVMCTHGGMGLSSDILGYPKASTALVRAVVGFMRNLCADDMRKENLGEPCNS